MGRAFGFKPYATKLNILENISDEDIFRRYCTNFTELGVKFCSEFREDSIPSCHITRRGGVLWYKDFGSPERGMSCFEYVAYKYRTTMRGALAIIVRDFELDFDVDTMETKSNYRDYHPPSRVTPKPSGGSVINVIFRKFNKDDKEFWGAYGITKETLRKFRVIPITYFTIKGRLIAADPLAYCYYYYKYEGRHLCKIYQPCRTSKDGKWVSNINSTVVQGEGMLPKSGDLLIITKSLKDVMVLYEMGITAIATNNEGALISSEYIEKQKARFKRVVLFMDNDQAGVRASELYSRAWGLSSIEIPLEEGFKDISDLVKGRGMEYAKSLLQQLLDAKEKTETNGVPNTGLSNGQEKE